MNDFEKSVAAAKAVADRITFTKKRPPGADLKGANRIVLLDGRPVAFLDASGAGGNAAFLMAGKFTMLHGGGAEEVQLALAKACIHHGLA